MFAKCLLAICLSVTVAAPLLAGGDKPDTRFTIYIVAGGTRGTGFTDPDMSRQDSASDLVGKLLYSKVWRPVEFEDQAAVTIEVLRREAHDDERTVYVRLIAGEFKIEIQGVGDESWSDAAGRLAKRLETWGKENAERLRELQSKAAPVPAKRKK